MSGAEPKPCEHAWECVSAYDNPKSWCSQCGSLRDEDLRDIRTPARLAEAEREATRYVQAYDAHVIEERCSSTRTETTATGFATAVSWLSPPSPLPAIVADPGMPRDEFELRSGDQRVRAKFSEAPCVPVLDEERTCERGTRGCVEKHGRE